MTRPGRARVLLLALIAPVLWTWAFVLVMDVRARAYLRHTRRQAGSASVRRQLDTWRREVRALLGVQVSQLMWPVSHAVWTPPHPRGRAVLCIHGFSQNGTNFWRLRRRLHARGRVTEAVLLGLPPRRVEAYADVLEAHLAARVAATPGPLDVVAHSMGGVVLRVVLARRPDLAARLGQVVTLGTPHFGTGSARGLPFPETRFLGRRSAALHALPLLSDLVDPRTLTTIGGEEDTTVYPVETTLDPQARHVRLPGLGHAGILWDPDAVAAVVATLARDLPPDAAR
ncbi:MAG: hypothetical protein H6732_10860 [Alphaproteobacteria bacterium]|nr:hypothetical protein [Alphaproteobacteria bacterium]